MIGLGSVPPCGPCDSEKHDGFDGPESTGLPPSDPPPSDPPPSDPPPSEAPDSAAPPSAAPLSVVPASNAATAGQTVPASWHFVLRLALSKGWHEAPVHADSSWPFV